MQPLNLPGSVSARSSTVVGTASLDFSNWSSGVFIRKIDTDACPHLLQLGAPLPLVPLGPSSGGQTVHNRFRGSIWHCEAAELVVPVSCKK
jgi:hypothetical protein